MCCINEPSDHRRSDLAMKSTSQQDGGTFGERAPWGSLANIFNGSLEKQSLTLFPVYYDYFSNLDI